MNENEIQKYSALSMPNVEYLADIPVDTINRVEHKTVSLSSINALGAGFASLVSEIGKVTSAGANGGSGLYYVNTMGKQMFEFNDGSGFLGSLANFGGTVGGGQARMTPVKACINPTAMMMSAALAGVSQKLDQIAETQREIIDYLEMRDMAKIIGNINTLTDISNNFCFNWDNEQYKSNKHALVQDIRRDSEQDIIMWRGMIKNGIERSKRYDKDLEEQFNNYRLALYQFAYSSYLEVMLLGNFDSMYLDSTIQKIEDYSFEWRLLYTECYDRIKNLSENSIKSRVISNASKLMKNAGKAIENVPVLNKSSVDEKFVGSGRKLEEFNDKENNKQLQRFRECSEANTHLFVESINTVKQLCSKEHEVLFDNKNMYLVDIDNQD